MRGIEFRRFGLLMVALVVAVSFAASALAAEDPASKDPVFDVDVIQGPLGERLHEFMSRRATTGFSGVLLVAKDGEVVIAKGYGLANRERQIPFTSQSVFDIGSITKQFTGAAIAKLEMQGKVNAADKLAKYFDQVPADKSQITLFHLLTHTAGLQGDFGGDYDGTSRAALIERVLNSKLQSPPGERHHYANSGFSLLAAVVEEASGQPYEAYLREQLWLPAGMQHTGYRLPKWPAGAIVHGYEKTRDWGTPLDQRWAADGPYWNLRGNGGVLSTVWDLYRWHLALQGDTILSPEIKNRMVARRVKEEAGSDSWYSYGWSLSDSPRGTRIVEHNGGNGIFFADLVRFVDENTVIIAASNCSDHSASRYMRGIRGVVFP